MSIESNLEKSKSRRLLVLIRIHPLARKRFAICWVIGDTSPWWHLLLPVKYMPIVFALATSGVEQKSGGMALFVSPHLGYRYKFCTRRNRCPPVNQTICPWFQKNNLFENRRYDDLSLYHSVAFHGQSDLLFLFQSASHGLSTMLFVDVQFCALWLGQS